MPTERQPEVNIGLVGHVDHGKTTLTKALSGVWTDRHSEEIKKGISIRLGYADTSIYRCDKCDPPLNYSTEKKCKRCGGKAEFIRAVSFVDSPGHETLMATMISGSAIMDGALLLIAANEQCPQPQTIEHLMALEISGVRNVIILQNKIDLVSKEKLVEHHGDIKRFISGTSIADAPIIPISAHHDVNIEALIHAIEEHIPTPERDGELPARMNVARSFDVNKPGARPGDLRGGVIGGSLSQGTLSIGDEIEVVPGVKSADGKAWLPVHTVVRSLISGGKEYDAVDPGGLVGVGTALDPFYTKADSLIGNVMGAPGTLPPVRHEMTMGIHLLEKMVTSHGFDGSVETQPVEAIRTNTPLMLNVGTATTVGVVSSAREDVVDVKLKLAVAASDGDHVAISRRDGGRWRLIGYGVIQ
ncbi:MAG: translation initiation factor IF-2 subunit gamma [Thermoplasmata archaeon]|nr:translation initiation factor IF-2 subunit gamma [Thermoplasmata archaeon]